MTYIDEFIKTGNSTQSALKAGFSENYSRQISNRFPDKVRKSIYEALEARGITTNQIAEKIELLLNAQKNSNYDYKAIDKGITHAVKIRGDYAPDKNVNLNLNANIENKQEVFDLAEQYESELKEKLLE